MVSSVGVQMPKVPCVIEILLLFIVEQGLYLSSSLMGLISSDCYLLQVGLAEVEQLALEAEHLATEAVLVQSQNLGATGHQVEAMGHRAVATGHPVVDMGGQVVAMVHPMDNANSSGDVTFWQLVLPVCLCYAILLTTTTV